MAGFLGYATSGARWSGTTITYSFASTTAGTGPGGAFSGTIPVPANSEVSVVPYATYYAVSTAMDAWAAATGLTLRRVADSTAPGSTPDIRIGYGTLSGGVSAFSASTVNGVFQPGAEIMLQDPATDAISYNAARLPAYATGQLLGVVAESVAGHALGLAGWDAPSIRFHDIGSAVSIDAGEASPALINAASVAGLTALYGTAPKLVSPDAGTQSSLGVVTGPSLASYSVAGRTLKGTYALLPTTDLVSLTTDGTIQLQPNQPGSAVVTAPGARLLGQTGNNPRDFLIRGISDPTGNTERVARLYQAVLGRTPDVDGLYANANQVDQGVQSLAGVAANLVNSPEFIQAHPEASGPLSDAAFVATLYRNMLGRPVDPAGVSHLAALQNGASRGEVANGIAQSLEARLDYLPYGGDRSLGTIYRSYQAAFGRAPDPTGLATYAPALDAGVSAQELAAALIGSSEFAATSGAGSAASFVVQAYQNALGRAPDAAGLASYAGQIAGGASRAQVLADIGNSNEARAHSAIATHDGWVSVSL